MNRLIKSKYNVRAPITAFFPTNSPESLATYIFLIFCVSYAVNPTKIKTPIIEIAKYIIDDFRKIFTSEAIIIPIKPIIKNEPNLVKSLLVV